MAWRNSWWENDFGTATWGVTGGDVLRTDGEEHQWAYETDKRGRILKITPPADSDGVDRTTHSTFDDDGSGTFSAGSHTLTKSGTYKLRSHKVGDFDPTYYEYDAETTKITAIVDPADNRINYERNNSNWPAFVTKKQVDGASERWSYSYASGNGDLLTEKRYDSSGLQGTISHAYTYYADGKRLQQQVTTDIHDNTTTRHFNSNGTIDSVVADEADLEVTTQYTHDLMGRVRTRTLLREYSDHVEFEYFYDDVGRRTREWDDLDMLGNWLSTDTTIGDEDPETDTRTVNAANEYLTQQVGSAQEIDLTSDDNGNLTSNGTHIYAYDAENRLIRVTRKSDSVVLQEYAYDALGRRVRTVDLPEDEDEKVTTHVYAGSAACIAEYDSTAEEGETEERWFAHGPGFPDPLVMVDLTDLGDKSADAEEYLYYLKDLLGSVTALANSNGTVVERYVYDPYGGTTVLGPEGYPEAEYYHDADLDGDVDWEDDAHFTACYGSADARCVFVHDRDGDGRVDIDDSGYLAVCFTTNGVAPGDECKRSLMGFFDVNGDGVVALFDFTGFQQCFGATDDLCLVRVFEDANTNGAYNDGVDTVLVEYAYDALGRRVEKADHTVEQSPPLTTRYVYDGQNVIEGIDTNGFLERYFVNGPTYIDERVLMYDADSEQDYYYLLKELYSIAGLADETGRLVEAYAYDAYGKVRIETAGSVSFDSDDDGDTDLADFADFQECFSGGGTPSSCATALVDALDSDGDDDLDLDDLAAFVNCMDGPWVSLLATGDFNSNGVVDDDDAAAFDDCATNGSPGPACLTVFDFNTNGEIDMYDAGVMADLLGTFVDQPTHACLSTATGSTVGNPYFFTARRLDTITTTNGVKQIQYNRARYYNYDRWLQRDPGGYNDSPNTYEYVLSSPSRWIDWTGASAEKPSDGKPKPPSSEPPAPRPTRPGWHPKYGAQPDWRGRYLLFTKCKNRLASACSKYKCCKECPEKECNNSADKMCNDYMRKLSDWARKNRGKHQMCAIMAQIVKGFNLDNRCFKVVRASTAPPKRKHSFAAVFHVCNKTTTCDAKFDPWRWFCIADTSPLPYLPKCKPGGRCWPLDPRPSTPPAPSGEGQVAESL